MNVSGSYFVAVSETELASGSGSTYLAVLLDGVIPWGMIEPDPFRNETFVGLGEIVHRKADRESDRLGGSDTETGWYKNPAANPDVEIAVPLSSRRGRAGAVSPCDSTNNHPSA